MQSGSIKHKSKPHLSQRLPLLLAVASTLSYAQAANSAAVQSATPVKHIHVVRASSVSRDSSELQASFTSRATLQPNLTPVNTGPGLVYTCDPSIAAATCTYLNTTVAGWYNDTFTNANANIYITYGTTGLGSSTGYGNSVSYNQYVAALTANTNKSAVQTSALSAIAT